MLYNNKLTPLVSIILPTHERPIFLNLALEYYKYQDYLNKELIIVDDSAEPFNNEMIDCEDIIYIHRKERMLLGDKMNLGLSLARGEYILKMDDDDYYGSSFVTMMVNNLRLCELSTVSFVQPFIFFDLLKWELRISDDYRCSGATLFFSNSIGKKIGFRSIGKDVDSYFLIDYLNKTRVSKVKPIIMHHQFLQVRHKMHTWNFMPDGTRMDFYLSSLERYNKDPLDILPSWVLSVYKKIHQQLISI